MSKVSSMRAYIYTSWGVSRTKCRMPTVHRVGSQAVDSGPSTMRREVGLDVATWRKALTWPNSRSVVDGVDLVGLTRRAGESRDS